MIIRLSPAPYNHRRMLDLAFLCGAMAPRTYVTLWRHYARHGERWRWN